MGDDVHMRTPGTTNLLLRDLLPQLAALPDDGRVELARFLSGNHLFFLNLAMAAAKSVAAVGEQVDGSEHRHHDVPQRHGVPTASGWPGRPIFLAAAPPVSGRRCTTRTTVRRPARPTSATARSSIVGLGGAAAAGSPAVAGFLGGAWPTQRDHRRDDPVCAGQSTRFKLPTWNYPGTPLGVDVRPGGGAEHHPEGDHRHPARVGVGQIGAGVAAAPIECFRAAVRAWLRDEAPCRDGGGADRDAPAGTVG